MFAISAIVVTVLATATALLASRWTLQRRSSLSAVAAGFLESTAIVFAAWVIGAKVVTQIAASQEDGMLLLWLWGVALLFAFAVTNIITAVFIARWSQVARTAT